MAILKPKTGRRAGELDRSIAAEWAQLYREAQRQPDGRLCLNPENPPDEQTWIDGNDPEHLLRMLEGFAEHGTFEFVGPLADSIRLWPLRAAYKRAREAGQSHQSVVLSLAEEYGATERTIERKLKSDKP